jgi:hypothetical protein
VQARGDPVGAPRHHGRGKPRKDASVEKLPGGSHNRNAAQVGAVEFNLDLERARWMLDPHPRTIGRDSDVGGDAAGQYRKLAG